MRPVDITDFMLWKLIALGALAFFGNMWFTYRTGKSLTEVRRELAEREDSTPPK